jgi:hypothetical protein
MNLPGDAVPVEQSFAYQFRCFLAASGVTVPRIAAATLCSTTDLHELLCGRRRAATADLERLFTLYELRVAPDWRKRLFFAHLRDAYPKSWIEMLSD